MSKLRMNLSLAQTGISVPTVENPFLLYCPNDYVLFYLNNSPFFFYASKMTNSLSIKEEEEEEESSLL